MMSAVELNFFAKRNCAESMPSSSGVSSADDGSVSWSVDSPGDRIFKFLVWIVIRLIALRKIKSTVRDLLGTYLESFKMKS